MIYQRVDELVRSLVKDKSFLDIGPLWGTVFEKLSVAHEGGAKSLTAVDAFQADNQLWVALKDRLKGLQVSYHSTDIMYFDGQFDVVYCSGVIYHQPDPFLFLQKLFALTKQHLVLKTTITDLVPDGGCLFVPAIQDEDELRKLVANEWGEFLKGFTIPGLTTRKDDWVPNCSDWWWLFTGSYLVSMCRLCGFEIDNYERIGQREVMLHCQKRACQVEPKLF